MLLGSSIVFQPMGKSVRFDLMLKLSLCFSEHHAENHRSGEMAALRDSESEEGMFLGSTEEDQLKTFQTSQTPKEKRLKKHGMSMKTPLRFCHSLWPLAQLLVSQRMELQKNFTYLMFQNTS